MPHCSYISQHLFTTCTILLEGDKASTQNFVGETTWKISDRRTTLLNSLLLTQVARKGEQWHDLMITSNSRLQYQQY